MRRLFWSDSANYVFNTSTGAPRPGVSVTMWTTQSGGSQVTDLQFIDSSGNSTGSVPGGTFTTDAQGFIASFAGPPDGTGVLWADAGTTRRALRALVAPSDRYIPASSAGPWGAGLTSVGALSTAWDTTRATANGAALDAMVAYAAANGLDIWWGDGVYDLQKRKDVTSCVSHHGAGTKRTYLRFPEFSRAVGSFQLDVAGATITTRGSALHGLTAGTQIQFAASTYSNVAINTTYFVIATGLTTTAFQISTTLGGGALTPTPTGSDVLIWLPDCAWVWGDNSTSYVDAFPAFWNLTIIGRGATGPNPQAPTSGGVPQMYVGLCINGVTGVHMDNVSIRGFGVGWDAINNSGGLVLDNCWSKNGCCHVCVQARGLSGSGSDWTINGCWFAGVYSAFAMDANCTDFWIMGGQMYANHGNRLALSAASDFVGALWVGRNALDGAIGSDGAPGVVQSSASTGYITATHVDFEGTRFGWVAARGWGSSTIILDADNCIAYPTGSTYTSGSGSGGCSGILKVSNAGVGNFTLRDLNVKGSYEGATNGSFVNIAGMTAGGEYHEERTSGKQAACIGTGPYAGNSLSGDWIQANYSMAFMSNLATLLSGTGIYTTDGRGVHETWVNGARVFIRPSTTGIEYSLDGTTFRKSGATVGRTGTPPTTALWSGPKLVGTSAITPALNDILAIAWDVPDDFPAVQLASGCTVLQTSAALRLGIFADDGTACKPGAVIIDGGTIAGTAVADNLTTSTFGSVAIGGRRVWLVGRAEGAAGTVQYRGGQPVFKIPGALATASETDVLKATGSTNAFSTGWPCGGTPVANVALGYVIRVKVA